jgi:hypothetical protein
MSTTAPEAEPKAPATSKAKATKAGLTAAGYVTFTDRLVRHFHLAESGQQPAEDGVVRAACGARFWPNKAEMAFEVGQDLALVSCGTCTKATKSEAEVVATVTAIEKAVEAAKADTPAKPRRARRPEAVKAPAAE